MPDADVQVLQARTEGWIAGLKLAALSLRTQTDVRRVIESFSGSTRYVYDYLLEEVLHKQTEDIRSFLMQTSVLERLFGPLCDAVTSRSGGSEMLEDLERANLFLVPLDNDRQWFRYHPLFSDLLRFRLEREAAVKRDSFPFPCVGSETFAFRRIALARFFW